MNPNAACGNDVAPRSNVRAATPGMLVTRNDHLERDTLIHSQPILWAQAMLEEAEKARSLDARDAILARVGATLYSRFGVTFSPSEMRRADAVWMEEREVLS